MKASLVTVILRNSGDNPALGSEAEFNFSSITEVGCPYGAGGTQVKARYDIKVPVEAQAPLKQVRKMKYTPSAPRAGASGLHGWTGIGRHRCAAPGLHVHDHPSSR
ncbi:hypothetical protein GCM10011583_73440 [Streptomyces camponoticapitis]|uniref:DUF11 domain-containing protein n=1 Tax=Streptomyces camponoticapitis TaxID=1616125 RepID=A0ABQ2F0D1_9ACTN|nr:hypothetical protein GCM10011583_73440 [Streptomyces camponoticapitis]